MNTSSMWSKVKRAAGVCGVVITFTTALSIGTGWLRFGVQEANKVFRQESRPLPVPVAQQWWAYWRFYWSHLDWLDGAPALVLGTRQFYETHFSRFDPRTEHPGEYRIQFYAHQLTGHLFLYRGQQVTIYGRISQVSILEGDSRRPAYVIWHLQVTDPENTFYRAECYWDAPESKAYSVGQTVWVRGLAVAEGSIPANPSGFTDNIVLICTHVARQHEP